jgi:hypothetical protein
LNRAILYCPFVPFSILFTRAVQLADIADLARLDRFAASLQPKARLLDEITHPHQLYTLLCRAARLYFDLDLASPHIHQTLIPDVKDIWGEFEFAQSGIEAKGGESWMAGGTQAHGLYDWSQDSQQIMGLLSEDVMF